MFCRNCGSDLSEGTRFCAKCGAAVNAQPEANQNESVPTGAVYGGQAQPAYNPAPAYAGAGYQQHNLAEYRKLGGFLKFLVVMYKFISPILLAVCFIMTSVTYISSISLLSRWSSYGGSMVTTAIAKIVFLWIIAGAATVGGAILCFVFGKKLENRDAGFLRFFQLAEIIMSVLLVVVVIMTNTGVSGVTTGSGVSIIKTIFTILWYMLIQVGAFLIWNTYFIKSVRVRVYMGTDKYLRNSIFNKNTRAPIDYTPEQS